MLHALSEPGDAPQIRTYVLATGDTGSTGPLPASTEPSRTTTSVQTETTARILNTDLNTADVSDLCTIDGVGEVLAQRILEAREQLGGFTRREQLLEIRGIGEELLNRICTVFVIPHEEPPVRTVPPRETSLPGPETPPAETTVTTLQERPFLEMNRMTLEQLRTVPGMTEQAALDILDMRSRIGYYSHPYELLLIETLDHDWIVSVLDCFYVTGVNDAVTSDHRN